MVMQHTHTVIRRKNMQKREKFEYPEVEVFYFQQKDIIVTSGGIDLPPDIWE